MSTPRVYGLWDARQSAYLRWRYYVHVRNAHKGALTEVRWARVGTTIEVVNRESGRMVGQYTLSAAGQIRFNGGK